MRERETGGRERETEMEKKQRESKTWCSVFERERGANEKEKKRG